MSSKLKFKNQLPHRKKSLFKLSILLTGNQFEIFKGLTLLGSDILILLLGYFLSQRSHRESTIIKAWLNTLVLGVLASMLVAFSTNQLAKVTVFHTDFFNAAFPLLRNTYPLIFGSLLGLILTAVINDQRFI